MNRHFLTGVAALSLLLLPASTLSLGGCASKPAAIEQTAAPLSAEELEKIAASITVKVLPKNGAGSGTLIGRQGQNYTVLTNQHVLTPGEPYRIQTPDAQTHAASLVKNINFQGNDLALLEFNAAGDYAVAALPENRFLGKLAEGDKVFAAGFPFDSEPSLLNGGQGGIAFTSGEIKLLPEKALQGGYRIGSANEIQQGMSGGPIVNKRGEAIGINGMGAYPILGDAYIFEDGSRPSEAQRQQMKQLSWGVPVQFVAQVAPERITNSAIPPLTGIAAEVNKKAAEITVRIDGQNDNGSGTIIAKQGNTYYVLTADHVVKNPGKYEVVTPDRARYPVNYSTVKRLEGVDLAVLQFQSNQTYSVATLGNYDIKEGGRYWVFISGWPGAQGTNNPSRMFTAGFVFSTELSSIVAKLTNGYELVYSNITQAGMSGGPVLDVRGRIIGIHAAAEGKGNQVYEVQLGNSLGVPVKTFLSLTEKAGIKPEWLSVETQAPPPSTDVEEEFSIIIAIITAPKPPSGAHETEWVNYGNQLWRSFRYDEAVKAFDEALKINPNFSPALYARGLVLDRQNKDEEALASFEKATESEPRFYEAWRERGRILSSLKRYPEALESIDKAIDFNDKDFFLYMLRGNLLRGLKRNSEARDAYSQAIKLNPYPFGYYIRGNTLLDLGDKQGAIDDFNKAIELKPDFAEVYNSLGNAHSALGNQQRAIDDYTKAIELQPDFALAYIRRGFIRKELGNQQEAIADFTKAIELQPNSAEAYMVRSGALSDLGNKQGAIEDLQKATQLYCAQGSPICKLGQDALKRLQQ